MIVVNTTVGWQVGDDLIREGALRVLGATADDAKFYVNRAQVGVGSYVEAYTTRAAAMPKPQDVMPRAKLFACAGTPEWFDLADDWWYHALNAGVPIALVGVGCMQPRAGDVVRQAVSLGLMVGATVRDAAAQKYLLACGVPDVQWFPCPSTAVEWDRRQGKRVVVLNPRVRCGPRPSGRAEFWLKGPGAEAIKSWGSAHVVVHEPDEVKAVQDALGVTPWFSSDPQDYKRLYERTEVYVGGRLHGALPVVASGGTAYLLPQAAKFDAARLIQALVPGPSSLRVLEAMEMPTEDGFALGRVDPAPMLRQLDNQAAAHAAYWSARAARWRR